MPGSTAAPIIVVRFMASIPCPYIYHLITGRFKCGTGHNWSTPCNSMTYQDPPLSPRRVPAVSSRYARSQIMPSRKHEKPTKSGFIVVFLDKSGCSGIITRNPLTSTRGFSIGSGVFYTPGLQYHRTKRATAGILAQDRSTLPGAANTWRSCPLQLCRPRFIENGQPAN